MEAIFAVCVGFVSARLMEVELEDERRRRTCSVCAAVAFHHVADTCSTHIVEALSYYTFLHRVPSSRHCIYQLKSSSKECTV